jgi:hypothetical protein
MSEDKWNQALGMLHVPLVGLTEGAPESGLLYAYPISVSDGHDAEQGEKSCPVSEG